MTLKEKNNTFPMNIRGEAATHDCWTGNRGQTARRREPELSGERERERTGN